MKRIDEKLMIYGRNSVLECLKSGENADKLYVQEGVKEGSVNKIVSLAKEKKIIVVWVPKEKLDKMTDGQRHQGVILNLCAVPFCEVSDILAKANEKDEPPFIFVLDGIEDPRNLGAIIRTANLSGAHGVIIPKHRAASLSALCAKASAGAIFHTLIAKVTNIAQTIEYLKENNVWTYAADMEGEGMYSVSLKGGAALVIGNEGAGVSRLVKERCDGLIKIPMKGNIDSLNASVAAGVLAWEYFRQNLHE